MAHLLSRLRLQRFSRHDRDVPHVRFWLGTVLTAPDKQRLLLPQQETFQPPRPLSHRFRLLLGDKRAYGGAMGAPVQLIAQRLLHA